MSKFQPAIFIGHGSPMNALEQNVYSKTWAAVGAAIPRPRAILVISAHWYISGLRVTAMAEPRTIHDFRGFPQALFDMQYPAPGAPDIAREIADILAPESVTLDQDWGLDHGSWQVLTHMFPLAEIPVLQLGIDRKTSPAQHMARGRSLAALRDEGVLILGSGNIVHNLGLMNPAMPEDGFDWALRFNELTRERFLNGDFARLAQFEENGRDADLAIPTPEHYLPLLYIAGAACDEDKRHILTDGYVLGSLSMLSVAVGEI